MLKNWKKPLYLLSVFALICLTIVVSASYFDENRVFNRYCKQIFKQEISANTLSLHYTLANPEEYGIQTDCVSLPKYTKEDLLNNISTLDGYIADLEKISPAKLSEDNRYTYLLLLSYFKSLRHLEEYPYYEAPFSPVNGIHSQFPILLSEYAFRTQKDVEDYLELLSCAQSYLTSLLEYQKDKTKAGLGTDDLSLDLASSQCFQVISEKDFQEGSHFLQTSFLEKIMPLLEKGILDKETTEQYVLENQRLLATILFPTYETLGKELTALKKGDQSTPRGMSVYPKGKEYYSALVKFQTGSNHSLSEMKNTLENLLSDYRVSLSKLITSSKDSLLLLEKAHEANWFSASPVPSILSHLQERMASDFPLFPDSQAPALSVKQVSDVLSQTSAPAFYLTPPIDDSMNNTIYLNPNSCSDTISLYTTLAHEGYPGHLYQTVYYHCYAQSQNVHPIRHMMNYEGYQEGWALYVEFLSYDYLSSYATSQGAYDLCLGYEIEKHNRMMQLCLYSLLDIYIHYDGYTESQILAYLSAMGISDTATAKAIYQYIANAPGNYLKYFWSYIEILSLKKNAMLLMKEQYSDLIFHQFFLECGPSDFDSLSRALALKKSLKFPRAF